MNSPIQNDHKIQNELRSGIYKKSKTLTSNKFNPQDLNRNLVCACVREEDGSYELAIAKSRDRLAS